MSQSNKKLGFGKGALSPKTSKDKLHSYSLPSAVSAQAESSVPNAHLGM